jgi:hypothetical protein
MPNLFSVVTGKQLVSLLSVTNIQAKVHSYWLVGNQAEAYLSQAEYSTGNGAEDQETQELVRRLVNCQRLRTACPIPFDEAQMWRGSDGAELKQQLQNHFRNIR